ncbi:WYL domain-containing protein [bacterium]|nr:WYL domain-containing protein [bacterium]
MFKPIEKSDLSQISLTGIRAIILLGLLSKRPRTFEEIKNAYIYYNVMEESNSDDIIRIDINTLKHMGCDISRCSNKTHEYTLEKHPFSIFVTSDEIKILKKTYKKFKTSADLSTLLELDNFFKKLAKYIYDDEIKEEFLGISFIKHYEIEFISKLIDDCKQNMILTLMYKKPTSNTDTRKEIIAQKLVTENDKIYLYGFDLDKQKQTVLNIKRIKAIIGRRLSKKTPSIKSTKVIFQLKSNMTNQLSDQEHIISSSDDTSIVEGIYYNNFLAMQRMLSFGPACIVMEPAEFKKDIIEKLKEMRDIYD